MLNRLGVISLLSRFINTVKALGLGLMSISFSLFYDALFLKHKWTNPDYRKATLALIGLLLLSLTGLGYASLRLLGYGADYNICIVALLLGAAFLCVGTWGKHPAMAIDIEKAYKVVRGRGSMLLNLEDEEYASALIEVLIMLAQEALLRKDLSTSQQYLTYASTIWVESMLRKGVKIAVGRQSA